MTTLLLIRHGTCDGVGQVLWGRTPGVYLNEQGRAQAHELADNVEGQAIAAVYASPLERTIETAEAIGRALHLDVTPRPALIEIDFGNWTGQSIRELDGDDTWRRFNLFRSITRAPGGETMLEVQVRMIAELERLCLKHPSERIAVVGHSDPLRAAIAQFAGTHLDFFHRFEISPASVSVIEVNQGGPKVIALNMNSDTLR